MPTRARAKTAKEPAKTATKAAKTEKPRKKERVLHCFSYMPVIAKSKSFYPANTTVDFSLGQIRDFWKSSSFNIF